MEGIKSGTCPRCALAVIKNTGAFAGRDGWDWWLDPVGSYTHWARSRGWERGGLGGAYIVTAFQTACGEPLTHERYAPGENPSPKEEKSF